MMTAAPACATSGVFSADGGITNHGMRWSGRPAADKAKIERAVALTEHAYWRATGLDPEESQTGELTVRFLEERPDCSDLPIGSVIRTCHGVLRGRYVYLKDEPCLAHTSIAHELIHYFALITLGHYDAGHADTRLWIVANIGKDKDDSAEGTAIAAMMYEGFCE